MMAMTVDNILSGRDITQLGNYQDNNNDDNDNRQSSQKYDDNHTKVENLKRERKISKIIAAPCFIVIAFLAFTSPLVNQNVSFLPFQTTSERFQTKTQRTKVFE